ncbi:DUF362 domain-containing protein, partial [Elusimicrobiota bacterium]
MSDVYFLPWDKREKLAKWLKNIGAFKHIQSREFVALKIHFGEEGNNGFIDPKTIKPIVRHIKDRTAWPFLTDANTIYVGKRSDALHHAITAEKHGFTTENCDCPVIIADGLRGNSGVDVEIHQKHFKSASIANAIHYAESLIFLSHFKGHELTGFGGTLKNIGMGCATRAGKYAMHHSVNPRVNIDHCTACGKCIQWCPAGALELKNKKIVFDNKKCIGCGECILSCVFNVFSIPWNESTKSVQEKIVEYSYAVLKNKKHFSVNFLKHITKYCDCYSDRGKPLTEDIGILASNDPVALDQASADMVNKKHG